VGKALERIAVDLVADLGEWR
jgi:hypothetical protein